MATDNPALGYGDDVVDVYGPVYVEVVGGRVGAEGAGDQLNVDDVDAAGAVDVVRCLLYTS